MIHPSGTFDYEAEFASESFGDSEVVVYGTSRRNSNTDSLVGHNPKLRFWNDRLVLIASATNGASARNCSFQIGNAVPLAAQPGDRLYVLRTGCGGIALSLLWDERLILAIGAVTAVPLGREVQVTVRPASKTRRG